MVLSAVREANGGYPSSVPVFDAVLMALAAFRITRLVVYDKVMGWFRELFRESRFGIVQTIDDLLKCPWCVGFWSAIIVAFCYFVFSWAWFVILFLAIAGASSFVQITANALGWLAESHKLDAQKKERRTDI